MPTKLIAAAVAGCLALAGAWALVSSPEQSNASASSTIPPESGEWEPSQESPHDALDGVTVVNSTVCFAVISHASLNHSPVCTIAQDHAQGVNQPHNTNLECPSCPNGGDEKTIIKKTITKTIVKGDDHDHDHDHAHDHGHDDHDHGDTTVIVDDSDTTTEDNDHTRDDTCTDNQETTCDQSEDNRHQKCHQSNDDALVNANVCNVQVDPVKDNTVNDVVDVARDDLIVQDPDGVDAKDAVDNALVLLSDETNVVQDSVEQEISEGDAAEI